MILFSLLLNLLTLSPAFGEPCGPTLWRAAPTVAEALKALLPVPDGDEARFARLDADLIAWAEARFERLTPRQRRNIVFILERPSWRSEYEVALPFVPDGVMDDASAAGIEYDERDVRLVFERLKRLSEVHRKHLLHELQHLFDLVPDGELSTFYARVEARKRRRLGIYRLDLPAHREDYRWIRRHYTLADVARLETLGGRDLDATIHALEADLSRPLTPAEARAKFRELERAFGRWADAAYARRVRFALAYAEPEYLKFYLSTYRGEQRRVTLGLDRLAARLIALRARLRRAIPRDTPAPRLVHRLT